VRHGAVILGAATTQVNEQARRHVQTAKSSPFFAVLTLLCWFARARVTGPRDWYHRCPSSEL